MKVDIPKANQIKIVISFVIVAIIITMIIVFRKDIFKIKNNITDSERFYTEYNKVGTDNLFKYVTVKEAIDLFKSEKAVVYFGFSSCGWCQSYVPILNEVAKENQADVIYYCDIKEDRKNNTDEYKSLVKILDKNLYDDDDGNKRIYVPDVYFVKDGKIVGHNNDTSTIEGADTEEYYTEKNKNELKNKLDTLFKKVFENCNDSKKGC